MGETDPDFAAPAPPSFGSLFGLSDLVRTNPSRVEWHSVDVGTPAGPKTLFVLVIDTVNGRFVFPFDDTTARAVCQGGLEAATGLTIAGGMPSG